MRKRGETEKRDMYMKTPFRIHVAPDMLKNRENEYISRRLTHDAYMKRGARRVSTKHKPNHKGAYYGNETENQLPVQCGDAA